MDTVAHVPVPSFLRLALRATAYVAAWLVLAVLIGAAVFFNSSREINLATHDTELRPTLSGYVALDSGPVLPDLRVPAGGRIGVEARLGKTNVASVEELFARYGFIASSPDGIRTRIETAVRDLAVDAAVRGLLLGAVPVLVWVLVGRQRRAELVRDLLRSRDGVVVVVLALLLVAGLTFPWDGVGEAADETEPAGTTEWMSLQAFLGEQVPVPAELDAIEVRGDVTTAQTRRLIGSAIDTYDRSQRFYAAVAESAAELELREPEEGETVVTVVSDRHDNVGMDPVARAIGDAAGATAVFDLGDDTSTGSAWEAFSLDSVTAAFEDLDRWAVTGNHDDGDFVGAYLAEHGWEVLDGEPVEGPDGTTLFGVPDPRSSGLGTWRDETGLSFAEVADRVAEEICAYEDRVETLLVHDANLGRDALERGCVDLVLGGHVHSQVGPTAVTGENGEVGYTFTTGTTGGAAYALAIGSKIRRPAQVTLVTYRDGEPVGLQPVVLDTTGTFRVGEYVELADLSPLTDAEGA